MKILCLTLDFQLPACRSLKDKRHRLHGLKDKFGGKANIAVSESGFHDQHDRARWSFVIVGENGRVIEAQKQQVQDHANHYFLQLSDKRQSARMTKHRST